MTALIMSQQLPIFLLSDNTIPVAVAMRQFIILAKMYLCYTNSEVEVWEMLFQYYILRNESYYILCDICSMFNHYQMS